MERTRVGTKVVSTAVEVNIPGTSRPSLDRKETFSTYEWSSNYSKFPTSKRNVIIKGLTKVQWKCLLGPAIFELVTIFFLKNSASASCDTYTRHLRMFFFLKYVSLCPKI